VPGIPPVRRRLLGTALREYRESLGFNLDEAARILECDRSKVSRIETGERGIRPKELRELLTEYGVPVTEQEALLAVSHRGRESGWWLDYRDVLSAAAQDYVIMEIAATEILLYEPTQVPDLLQTPDYIRAVAAADARYASGDQRAHAMEVKLNRQRIVVAGRAPGLDVVITEGALRQAVGPARVMREQLGRLADLAEAGPADGRPSGDTGAGNTGAGNTGAGNTGGEARSRVSLRVLPFAAGAHAAAGCGSMSLLRFAETPAIGVVHLPALSGGVSLEGRDEVARYTRTFAQLRSAAHTASRSAQLIRSIARSYDR
jgi:transcriptional regulator with XRE-family HTH domain